MTTLHELEANLIAKALQDTVLRAALRENPRAVLEREIGFELPKEMRVEVIEETPDTHYVILPESEWDLTPDDSAGRSVRRRASQWRARRRHLRRA